MKEAVYRVETGRLLLRCWSPEDAEAAKRAEDAFDDALVFTMLARDYERSRARTFEASAFDAGGRKSM